MSRRLAKWILVILALPILAFLAALLLGSQIPEAHTATSRAEFSVPPDSVWAVLVEFQNTNVWRPEVDRVERGPDRNGNPVWVEHSRTGELAYEVVEMSPPARLITRIADPDLPFGGTWIYTLRPTTRGTALTITEKGEIHHPIFRVFARYVFGYHSTMDGYLTALGARFGETTTPVHPAG